MAKKYLNIALTFGFVVVLGIASFLLRHQQEPCQTEGDGFVEITLFYSDSCHVCSEAKEFLIDLQQRYPEVKLVKCSISEKAVIKKWVEFYKHYNVSQDSFGAVPAIFTPSRYFIGFNDKVAEEIESCIVECQKAVTEPALVPTQKQEKDMIVLPLLGEIDAGRYSLPVLAVMLGFFDGFNVCSLGALVLILGLVLFLKDRKKILIFGGIFILTTALIYALLIVLWYHIFAFLASYLKTMEILIGLLAVGGAVYFLQQFLKYRKYGPACEADTGKGIMKRFSSKVQQTLEQGSRVLPVILAILLFAAVVTVVEFPCSAAVPLFFAGKLAEAGLPSLHYLLFIALFIIFYILDEIIVFLIAAWTMTIKLASKKFTTYLALIEAIILFALGLYYLFGFLIF